MRIYLLRRVLLLVPTLLIASFFVAGIARVMPGDALQAYLGAGRDVSTTLGERELAILKARLGLDDPFAVQYIRFILGWTDQEGRVLRSSFSDDTWRQLGEFSADPVTDLTFVTNVDGWSVGKEVLWGSGDAGRTWTPQHKADATMNAISAADVDHVWAVGNDGTIIHSEEGGRPTSGGGRRESTWLDQSSGVTLHLTDVVVSDTENVWAVGNGGTIIATSDGGATWHSQSSGTSEDLHSVAFADVNNGLAAGANGVILRTVDGGETWSAVGSGTSERLRSVAFAGTKAIAVGDGGTVTRSEDAGISWRMQEVSYVLDGDAPGEPVELRETLRGVGFIDEQRGFVYGNNGLILETPDGGESWERVSLIDSDDEPIPSKDLLAAWTVINERSGNVRYFVASSKSFWQWGAVGGNLGKSLVGTRTVTEDLRRTLAPTLQLGVMTILLATAVAVPLGILSAVRQDTWMDYTGRTIAIAGLAIPSFWLGTMVILLPAVLLDWTPPLQYIFFFDNPLANLKFFAIPVLVGGLFGSASVMRMTRSMMLEVLRQDYVRTAWSKGLRERVVIYRHALKNALIPVVTIIGMQVPLIVGGLVVIERLFSVPGIGRLLLDAVRLRDYPVIQGINLFFAAAVLLSNLIVDMTYGWLDPRIHYG